MQAGGMTAMEAIKASTSRSAKALGVDQIVGTIRPGLEADIIAVEGDPLRSDSALRKVRFVMRAGDVVASGALNSVFLDGAQEMEIGALIIPYGPRISPSELRVGWLAWPVDSHTAPEHEGIVPDTDRREAFTGQHGHGRVEWC